MIRATIVADSIGPSGKRITSFLLTYPRFIHAELMTHRLFSRNAASSRAIPIGRMIRDILRTPAKPVSWGQNGKGMQAKAELPRSRRKSAELVWLVASWFACGFSWLLSKLGVHKQLANRVTEPFAHMTTLVTATEFDNFFALRAHPDAQPEFQTLAFLMLREYLLSEPRRLKAGEWHLPFWRDQDEAKLDDEHGYLSLSAADELDVRLKVCTARCARTSYLNFFGKDSFAADFKLHDDLLKNGHMSPFEHCARAEAEPVVSGNFIGYTQYRKQFPNEVRRPTRAELADTLLAWERSVTAA